MQSAISKIMNLKLSFFRFNGGNKVLRRRKTRGSKPQSFGMPRHPLYLNYIFYDLFDPMFLIYGPIMCGMLDNRFCFFAISINNKDTILKK